ncbi:MAG: glycosyltransferase family 4 protein, partial [Planctomycetes bacterium]|nr:glycosyltransferase family 4 protein [Planctomycetota bacterium]
MRILYVVHTYPPDSWGGTELHVRGLARCLAKDHDVRIFCRSGDEARDDGSVAHGLEDGLLVARFNNLYRHDDSFEWVYSNPLVHEAFETELERFRPDLVHVHHLTSLSVTLIHACKSRGIPVVFTLHDFWTVCPRGQRLHPSLEICEVIDREICHNCLSPLWPAWFPPLNAEGLREADDLETPEPLRSFDAQLREALGLCDLLVTPSEFHRLKMLESLGTDPERMVAVPHGLDHAMFRRLHDGAREVRVIGYIGSVIPPKGVHLLIEAFRRLDDPDLELRIHGEAPVFHEERRYLSVLKERAQDARGAVRFLGRYDNGDVPRLLEDIDILVVPSLWWETFSLTIREAILAGVPVIAADLGAMREALEASRAGLLFRPNDAEHLAGRLEELIRDEDLRCNLSNRRLEVKTLQRNAEDYVEIYAKAREISQQREDIVVPEPRFPEKKAVARDGGPKDIKLSIEKVGNGDVRVESDVERGERTRVTFNFAYGPSSEATQLKVVIDFNEAGDQSESTPTPRPPRARSDRSPRREEAAPKPLRREPREDLVQKDVIPDSASFGAADMVRRATPEHEAESQEAAMYSMDERVFPEQVKKLDEMVGKTHLEDE